MFYQALRWGKDILSIWWLGQLWPLRFSCVAWDMTDLEIQESAIVLQRWIHFVICCDSLTNYTLEIKIVWKPHKALSLVGVVFLGAQRAATYLHCEVPWQILI